VPSASGDDEIRFDPNDPRFAEEGVPFDVLARIRREQPVYRTPVGDWYLARYEDVEAALVDVETFRAELGPITGIAAGCASIPEDQHFLSEIPEPRTAGSGACSTRSSRGIACARSSP